MKNADHDRLEQELDQLKHAHFPNHANKPVVLHREDIVHTRGDFAILQDAARRKAFDSDLLTALKRAQFRMVAVVIDKYRLWSSLGDAAPHPYSVALTFLLQRYVGYLNSINRVGDVIAEARGKQEDRLLMQTYQRIYDLGAPYLSAHSVQNALTSRSLKCEPKGKNIAGLQIADILANPIKRWVLVQSGVVATSVSSPFLSHLMTVAQTKFNARYSDRSIEGYGYVLYPKAVEK